MAVTSHIDITKPFRSYLRQSDEAAVYEQRIPSLGSWYGEKAKEIRL
jgi:hypothetical protein